MQHPHIPYALRGSCVYQVYWYHFLLNMQCWNRFHTQYITQNLLNEFEFVTPRMVEFYTIFLVLWRSWHWTISHLLCSVLIFFMVPILLGDNRKIELKWKQNLMPSRRYGYGAENLKNYETFEDSSTKFLSVIRHFKNFSVYV